MDKRTGEAASLLIATLAVSCSNFAIQILLAKNLSIEYFGSVAVLIAMVSLFQQFALMGAPQYLISVKAEKNDSKLRYEDLIQLVALNSLISSVTAVFLVLSLIKVESLYDLLIVISVIPLSIIDLMVARLQTEKKFFAASLYILTLAVFKFTLLAIFLYLFKGTWVVGAAFFFSGAAIITLAMIWDNRNKFAKIVEFKKYSSPSPLNFERLWSNLAQLTPFATDFILYSIYYQAPLVILGLIDISLVGYFASAYILINVLYIIPVVICQKIMPIYIAESVALDLTHKDNQIYPNKLIYLYITVCVCSVAIFYFLSEYFITMIYGQKFQASAVLLEIMVFAVPARYATILIGSIFVTRDDVRVRNGVFLTLVLIALVTYTGSIFFADIIGAAYALVFIEYIWMLVFFAALRKTKYIKGKNSEF